MFFNIAAGNLAYASNDWVGHFSRRASKDYSAAPLFNR
jgi:hypothetical protein